MKLVRLFLVLVILAGDSAFADCIDVSGIFSSNEDSAVRLTQNSCLTLKIEFGTKRIDGTIDWYKIPIRASLDGRPVCSQFGCVVGRADSSKITLSRDKVWIIYDSIHGDCAYHQEEYVIDVNPVDLVRRQNVFDCSDGFSGWIEKPLTRMN